MNKTIIQVNSNSYIVITDNNLQALYSYYNNDNCKKSSFNKYAFIEYLKGIQVPKKYIKQL